MVRYACHCVRYVESFQMSSDIMGLACEGGDGVRAVRVCVYLCRVTDKGQSTVASHHSSDVGEC